MLSTKSLGLAVISSAAVAAAAAPSAEATFGQGSPCTGYPLASGTTCTHGVNHVYKYVQGDSLNGQGICVGLSGDSGHQNCKGTIGGGYNFVSCVSLCAYQGRGWYTYVHNHGLDFDDFSLSFSFV